MSEGPRQVTSLAPIPDLPESVEQLLEEHDWRFLPTKTSPLSVMWEHQAEEQRMATLLTASMDTVEPPMRPSDVTREKGLIRGMIKVRVYAREHPNRMLMARL